MIKSTRMIAFYGVSAAVLLTMVYCKAVWAQASQYCVVGSTVTVTGIIDRVKQRPDGAEWAFTIRDKKSEPCKVDGVILSDRVQPAACQPGKTITATGKVHLFNPKNPNSQIVVTKVAECGRTMAHVQAEKDCEKENGDVAIAACDIAIRENPGNAVNFKNRGWEFNIKGDFDRAFADYSEAIRLNPRLVSAIVGRGNIYRVKGELERAIADYSEAIRLNPKYPRAFSGRAFIHWDKDDYDRALADFNEAIRLDPDDENSFNGRANVYHMKQDFDRARADYNESIRLNPNYAPAFNGRGWMYRDSGDLNLALADFDEAIRLRPNYDLAFYNRGIAHLKKGDKDRAIADFRRAAEIGNKSAREELIKLGVSP